MSMLSSLTLHVDHHDALLRAPEVLQSLLGAITSADLVPQVGCSPVRNGITF